MNQRVFPPFSATASLGGLLFVLTAMWYAASTQNNAAVYLLMFALTSVFLVSIPHTLLNLGGLKATAQSVKPTFAGQEVSLPVEIMNESRATRRAVTLNLPGSGSARETVDAIAPGKAARVMLRFPASARGKYKIETLCLTSVYPLGFLRARRNVAAEQHYLVYPKPGGDPNLPTTGARTKQNRPQRGFGEGDDFAGVRAYISGESQRHIDWKAVARGQPPMTKQFTTESDGVLYLDFSAVPFTDPEHRLSQLALWIIEAERARHSYGLRLPSAQISPALGDAHFHRCLRALALFQ